MYLVGKTTEMNAAALALWSYVKTFLKCPFTSLLLDILAQMSNLAAYECQEQADLTLVASSCTSGCQNQASKELLVPNIDYSCLKSVNTREQTSYPREKDRNLRHVAQNDQRLGIVT